MIGILIGLALMLFVPPTSPLWNEPPRRHHHGPVICFVQAGEEEHDGRCPHRGDH